MLLRSPFVQQIVEGFFSNPHYFSTVTPLILFRVQRLSTKSCENSQLTGRLYFGINYLHLC